MLSILAQRLTGEVTEEQSHDSRKPRQNCTLFVPCHRCNCATRESVSACLARVNGGATLLHPRFSVDYCN